MFFFSFFFFHLFCNSCTVCIQVATCRLAYRARSAVYFKTFSTFVLLICEQWRMDVHFVHDHSCLTFVKFCLYGALHLLLSFYKLLFSSKTMFRVSLISLFFVFIVCSFCGKDFKSLGQAKSRDKERKNANTTGDSVYETSLPVIDSELCSSTCVSVKCSCGKICNGQRGLKMHQSSCRVIKDLSGETFENESIDDCLPTTESAPIIDDQINIKVGVKLPRSDDQWKSANEYFQLLLPIHDIASSDLTTTIIHMHTVIYDYFENNFGAVTSTKLLDLEKQYKAFSKHSLKSHLRYLKSVSADPAEIKVVSHILRCRLDATKPTLNEGQVDENIKKNFWGFVKSTFKQGTSLLPSFDVTTCTNFFARTFSSINPFKSFEIPSWIPPLPAPTVQ